MAKEELLIKAASNGDIETVKKLLAPGFPELATGANVNAKDNEGLTSLMSAALNGHKALVELLLARGAEVNVQDKDGNTALLLAADKGHTEIVASLLAKGADVQAKNNNGDTALALAASWGHRGIVASLLAKGAKVNIQNSKGETALKIAAANGYTEIVSLLRGQSAVPAYNPGAPIDLGNIQQVLDSLQPEFAKAAQARDRAEQDEWIRKGRPGAGHSHICEMCHVNQAGYRCKECGAEYCKDCLEKNAPSNAYGGKSCPKCFRNGKEGLFGHIFS